MKPLGITVADRIAPVSSSERDRQVRELLKRLPMATAPLPLAITSDLCCGWTACSRCHIEKPLLKVEEQLEGRASRIQRMNPLNSMSLPTLEGTNEVYVVLILC